VALVGTTASGKSAIAFDAARRAGDVELVSVDSMAVYREMDLATAKPSPAQRAEVPHHLLDVLDPSEECSVSLFSQLAGAAIEDVRRRGRVPLLVGGTGLYHRAVIDELEIPPEFPEMRQRLEQEMSAPAGQAAAYARLARRDPPAAARIEPGNARRIARALEVIEGTGRPFSSFGPGLESYPQANVEQLGLVAEPPSTAAVIAARVEGWMAAGLLEEVKQLADRPAGLGRTARQAIGYRELLEVVELGAPLNEAVERTISRTRGLARRQRAWFRRDPRVAWVEPQKAAEALDRLLGRVRAGLKVRD
jgi:tRNA dimethylallyltransferase